MTEKNNEEQIDDLGQESNTTNLSRRAILTGGAAAALIGAASLVTNKNANASTVLQDWYNLKTDFGALGDNVTDDTKAWITAITTASDAQRPLFVPPGSYIITQALDIPPNTMIVGSNEGLGFGCVLKPDGCPAFNIGNITTKSFHSSIENLMIWPKGVAPNHIISIDNSYSIQIRNIRIFNAQRDLTEAVVVLQGNKSNNIIWENLLVRNGSQGLLGILAKANCGTHRFINPDIENFAVLFEWQGGQLDFITPYTERAGKHALNCNVDPLDVTAYLNTYGGFFNANSSGIPLAIRSTTQNFNSFGTRYQRGRANAQDGFAVFVYSLPKGPVKFFGIEPNFTGTGPLMFSGVPGWQHSVDFPDLRLSGSLAINTLINKENQIIATIPVTGVRLGLHSARVTIDVDAQGVHFSAYVSADDQVTVMASSTQGLTLTGTLSVNCVWG